MLNAEHQGKTLNATSVFNVKPLELGVLHLAYSFQLFLWHCFSKTK